MARLKLVLPRLDHEKKIMDYKREFIENGDRLYGTGGLRNSENFNAWYNSFCNKLNEETVRKGLSPETTYLAISIDNSHLIGFVNIRHRLNDALMKSGGHIDYSVRMSQRNKGYAIEMLGLALKECTRLDIKKVLITCDKDNIASAKTIINNGGKLENEIKEKNKLTQRYWISVD
jgi:predicted acetyltransferase